MTKNAKDAKDAEATGSEVTETEATELDESGADESGADETAADEPAADEVEAVKERSPRGPLRRLLVPIALAALLLISIGAATWTYLAMYQPDRQTSDAVKARVIQEASDGTVALLSYAPDTLDKDFANAKTHLTGDFLSYYTQFTQDIVTPAARQKSVKTSASVVRSAMAQLQPDSAEVLLFINQSTMSKENPDGAFTASSVKVGMTKVGDQWLINAFDPV